MLVLALGASAVPAFTHALTFGAHPLALNGIVADLEQGWSRSVAFVVPRGCTWPLPLYELALMTAQDVWAMNMDRVELHLVTPELEPLEIFGARRRAPPSPSCSTPRGSPSTSACARRSRAAAASRPGPAPLLDVDCVVALPRARRAAGSTASRATAHGFIPVDDAGLVAGLDSVYAVGDATDRPIKQGGLACQQADVTAAHIAARAGAGIEVPPLRAGAPRPPADGHARPLPAPRPRRGRGAGPTRRFLVAEKVSGKYLSPYLVAKDVVHLPLRKPRAAPGIDVHVPLTWQQRRAAEVLGLSRS